MSQTIAIVNQKGGVAKTTTCINLGAGLAMQGKRVLLIDCDPQGSLTLALGNPKPDELPITLSSLMTQAMLDEELNTGQAILHHPEGMDYIPANIDLSTIEISLVNVMSRETILQQCLHQVQKDYDYILIDCLPSLGNLTLNALVAADRVLIPAQPEYLSAKGLESLMKTIHRARVKINPKLTVDGVLFTMVDRRTNYARETISLLRDAYGSGLHIYNTEIPRSVRAAEASNEGQSIFCHDPKGKVAGAYRALAEEVMSHEQQRTKDAPDIAR